MTDSFRRACLTAAVIAACAFSAFQILHDIRVPLSLSPGVAARVNGKSIDSESVSRTVAAMDSRERRSESIARQAVLSRMIDEELLVQHALESGAAENNPEVRAALVRSAIARVNAEAAAEPVSDRELTDYFRTHSESYATSARFEVTPLYFTREGSPAAAPFDFPTQPVSARTLGNYFGPAAVDLVQRLSPGQIGDPLPFGDGSVRFHLGEKVAGEIPALQSIHDLVRADALRDRQERALQSLLASLHNSARIESHE